MIGRMASEVSIELTGTWKGSAIEAALDGKPQHDERVWPLADGGTDVYERFMVPDLDTQGGLRGCTAVWLDITARKEAENRIHRLNRVYAVLSNINAALVRVKNLRDLSDEACRIAVEHGGFGVSWIGLLDNATGRVSSLSWAGGDAEAFVTMENTASDPHVDRSGLLSQCIREKRPVFNNDIAALALPAGSRRQRAAELGYQSVIALEVIEKEKRIDYLAYYDSLTELPNRNLLSERLGQLLQAAAPRAQRVAVLLLDIRRFRFVNESIGRPSGDNTLREFAHRLRGSWPEPDNVGRISADRFALILGDCGNEAELLLAIEQSVISAFQPPFKVDGHDFSLSAVAGIALYPEDGADIDTLFKNAEAALKQAKTAAEPYMFYQPKMNARMAHTLMLESKMRLALEKEHFVLHYQPKVRTHGARIAGFEALIRWNDPDGGLVSPADFIPILEETGMITEVGLWALRRVLRDQAEWRQRGIDVPRVAVNVSAIQLRRRDFTSQVSALLANTSGHMLDIEITESLLMEDIEGCIEKLKVIRDLGVKISIDDFGTGYSSLAYLSRLPVHALKIDRSFIEGMLKNSENMSIVSSVISLAHALKLKVIAEGVETDEQCQVLQDLDCDEIQGSLISKPLVADEVARMLQQRALAA